MKAARREVEAAGGHGLDLEVDVSERDSIEAAAEAIEEELGPIDVWVNNAMVGVLDEFLDVDPEDFERVTSVTYLGYVNGTRSALKRMVPRDQGTVIQVGSALAFRAIPLQAAYCGAKHAIEGFTESVRCELLHRKSGVRITEVHLPALNTLFGPGLLEPFTADIHLIVHDHGVLSPQQIAEGSTTSDRATRVSTCSSRRMR